MGKHENDNFNDIDVEEEVQPRRSVWRSIGRLAAYAVIAFIVVFVIETFIARSYYIPSESMATTLEVNDHIIAEQVSPRVGGLNHGDIVVFEDPDNWLPASYKVPHQPSLTDYLFNPIYDLMGIQHQNEENNLIKRVIGLPGDTVSCCSSTGHVMVNGVEITEPYVSLPPGAKDVSEVEFNVTVPEGFVWVMGDNRYNCSDSRYHQNDKNGGFVPIKNVKGHAFAITWTVPHISWLGNYPEVFAAVPKNN